MTMVRLPVIAHDLEPSNHRPNSKETKNLCTHNSDCSQLLSVHVADGGENCLGFICAEAGHECSRITQGVGHRLKVSLKLSDRPIAWLIEIQTSAFLEAYGGDIFWP